MRLDGLEDAIIVMDRVQPQEAGRKAMVTMMLRDERPCLVASDGAKL